MDKFTIRNLELWYNDFKALKGIDMKIPEKEITAFIGPSGCGKSTLLKTLNRMNDLVEGCRISGEVLLDKDNIYKGMDPSLLRKRVGMVFQKPNPFPMSIYDNIAFGPQHPRDPFSQRTGSTIVEDIPARSRHLGRGQGPAEKERAGTLRRTAAASVHCQSTGGQAGGAAYGRADFSAGSDLDVQNRGPGR